jgi:uncharacterized membrane protein HdeD (DUF308 family)
MSAGLARNWWAMGLRAVVAALFAIGIFTSRSTLAALIMMFAAYVAFDGLFAIVAGLRAARRGERWWMFVLEGSINLGAAVGVLAWQAVAAVALVPFASVWAILSGGAMLAAASRLAHSHGRWILAFAGGLSVGWGTLIAAVGAGDARIVGFWLAAYGIVFGAAMLALSGRLHGQQRVSAAMQ